MAAAFPHSAFVPSKERAKQSEQQGQEAPLTLLWDRVSDTPLGVGFVLPVPGMPDHSALPNDRIRTGYPHAFEHQPVESKFIKHPTDVGCSATPSTNKHCFYLPFFFFFL